MEGRNSQSWDRYNLPVSAYQDAELDSKGRPKGMRCLYCRWRAANDGVTVP